MNTRRIVTLGMDVSKDNVTCCTLDGYPKGGLANYWAKTRAKLNQSYPRFYSNPTGSEKSAFDFVEWVKETNPVCAFMEPTGHHYSKLWKTLLEETGVNVLWIGHVELKRYREGKNLPGRGKNDAVDALAIAAYPLDPENHDGNGNLTTSKFLFSSAESVSEIREVCQQLDHLNRLKNPIINFLRQRLAWEFPEVAQRNLRSSTEYLPPLIGWLMGDDTLASTGGWTRIDNEYGNSIALAYGIRITRFTRAHAGTLAMVMKLEMLVENQLADILDYPEFRKYLEVFDAFGFNLRTRARLLSRIFPFESFLLPNGKPWIERVQKDPSSTKKTKSRNGSQSRSELNLNCTSKRNRSRDIFKLRIGMGTVVEASGDSTKTIPGGSSVCRKALWLYVFSSVETGKLPDTEVCKKLIQHRDYLKSQVDGNGKPLIKGKLIQMKLMSKTANLLFSTLSSTFWVG